MKISVVTISFNQVSYLEECIKSVAMQMGPWEHIIVDPGSTDGSREIIRSYARHFSHTVLSPDKGPADGLNKGFELASGEIFAYLNSDDVFTPSVFEDVRIFFENNPNIDVVSGYAKIINEKGELLRYVYSDPLTKRRLAYGGGLLIQPATFFRRSAFLLSGGFNPENRSNWDGELVTDMFLNGVKFGLSNKMWAGYRVHDESITGTGKLNDRIELWAQRRYQKLMGRSVPAYAGFLRRYYSLSRIIRHPDIMISRLIGRTVYGSKRK